MSKISVGNVVKIKYISQLVYILKVEIISIDSPEEFVGRVEEVFAQNFGEVTRGNILGLKDKVIKHQIIDIVE